MAEARVPLEGIVEILRAADLVEEVRGSPDVELRRGCQDSRAAGAGDLFMAWKGAAADGHDFVADAVRAGAVAALVERPVDVDVPQVVVRDGRTAAALAADALCGSPWRDMFTAAITGTNGKTTTALLARHVLAGTGRAAAVGTLGVVTDDGVRPGTEGLTTPGPAQVAGWLSDLAGEGVEAVVMEASSHALEQRRLDGVRFDAVVFTNLGRDHLDYHATLEEYRRAKLGLLRLAGDGATVVVNRDDPAWDDLDPGRLRLLTFGEHGDADVRAEGLELSADGARFELVLGPGPGRPLHLPLLGRHNVENALAAAAIALVAGRTPGQIAERLAAAPQVAGRLELVHAGEFVVLIDFAHTPDALENVLEAVRAVTPGRVLVVFGAGGDRDRTKRRPMGEVAGRLADVVVLTSDNPRTEDPDAILDEVAAGLAGRPYVRERDRAAAIRRALDEAAPGDAVLLAGKGHETYQVVGTGKIPFDERAVVREWLASRGTS